MAGNRERQVGITSDRQTQGVSDRFSERDPSMRIETGTIVHNVYPHPHDLNDCAEQLISWIGSLDPMWKERLTIMRAERGFTASQMLGTCAAHVLDESLHMILVPHDALQPNPWRVGEQMRCQGCETLFDPKYPGQPFCGNACAERSRAAVV